MPGWHDRSFHRSLAAVAAAALALRLLVVLLHAGTPVPVDHDAVARAGALAGPDAGGLADSAALVEQVAANPDGGPPLWPAVRTAATLGLGGTTGHQLVAALLGTLTVVLVGFVGYRLGGRRTALVAAAIAGAYPGLWVYESAAMAESLLLCGLAGTILLAYAHFDRPGWRTAAGLGAAAGALALVRTEQLLVVAALVVPLIAVRARGDRRRLATQLGAAAVGLLVAVGPWWASTTAAHQATVPVSVGLGADLAAGACRPTLQGPADGLTDDRCAFVAGTRLTGAATTDAGARDAALRDRGLELLGRQGERLPLDGAVRLGRVAGLLGPAQTVDRWSAWSHQPAPVLALWLGAGLVLAVLAVRGASALRAQRIPLLPLLSLVAVAATTVVAFGGDLRYRATAAVPLVLLGAVGLTWQTLAPPLQRRRGKLRPPAVAWRSSMPDDFWDELVERLARMDDDQPLAPSAAAAPRPGERPARPATPATPAPRAARAAQGTIEGAMPAAGAPDRGGDSGDDDIVIDLRDLPPPPVGVAPWPVPVPAPGDVPPVPVGADVGAGAGARTTRAQVRGPGPDRRPPIGLADLLHPTTSERPTVLGTGDVRPGAEHRAATRSTPVRSSTAGGLPLPPPPRRPGRARHPSAGGAAASTADDRQRGAPPPGTAPLR